MSAQSNRQVVSDPTLCEPFNNGRQTGRLLYDLGAMISLLNPAMSNSAILDFGAGTCWITEFIARMGLRVTAFDIHANLEGCINGRVSADARLDRSLIEFGTGDGHAMPFPDASFGHLLCYDTLHHMHDYDKVFLEFSRVLKAGGRAIFVEPGARHASSPETIAFLKDKAHDPTWIERNVVLEEINICATNAGFEALNVVPLPHPNAPIIMPLAGWLDYRNGGEAWRNVFSERMSQVNYDERVVFFCDKPSTK